MAACGKVVAGTSAAAELPHSGELEYIWFTDACDGNTGMHDPKPTAGEIGRELIGCILGTQ